MYAVFLIHFKNGLVDKQKTCADLKKEVFCLTENSIKKGEILLRDLNFDYIMYNFVYV